MIHAFQEIYLSSFRRHLGEAFDYAINTCNINGSDFVAMFLVSDISTKMEHGEVDWLVGKSGVEITKELYLEATGKELLLEQSMLDRRSAEFWVGWVAAYYQWYSDRSYQEIFEAVSFEDMKEMYLTLHEADVTKFVEIMEERIKDTFPETKLKRLRVFCGYSQSELSRGSGVSLRSIQMYEQRNKDINKASVETIYRLSKYLGCRMEDLLEH